MAGEQLSEDGQQSLLATACGDTLEYDTLAYDYSEYCISCVLSEWSDWAREAFG
jgi:hypothetical protein